MVPGGFLWLFKVPGRSSWFFMILGRLLWFQVGFSWFSSTMYTPKLYPGPC